MIIVVHKNQKVIRVEMEKSLLNGYGGISTGMALCDIATKYPSQILVWCQEGLYESVDFLSIPSFLHHNKMMLSYNPNTDNYLGREIGYVEQSPFIKINKEVTYPTWQMSSFAGAISAKVLNEVGSKIPMDNDFDYWLNSLAKICMPLGLFCYSEPKLLRSSCVTIQKEASNFKLFRFVRQHYKLRWTFFLLLNVFFYEKRLLLLSFLMSLFYKERRGVPIDLDSISVNSSKKVIDKGTLDVIIPTIGRPQHLHNVVLDLAVQTFLPKKVIVVEQNPDVDSQTELGFIKEENWPFEIEHFFIHQSGACNARNIALNGVESEWVFLCDDDNRFSPELLEDVFGMIKLYGAEVLLTAYPQKNELIKYNKVHQTSIFGSGNSFVKSEKLSQVSFDPNYEFNYGEDFDFGMQLRGVGVDIVYVPQPFINHLKAPMGGFRTKFCNPWEDDKIQPKPSPTIMYSKLKYTSREQLFGYKTILFLKLAKNDLFMNVFLFNKRWNKSLYWSNLLGKQDDNK